MADGSKIEWTDATWNPVRGCTRVSEGCRHCYAERVAARFAGAGQPYDGLAETVTRPDGSRQARWTGKLTFGHNLDAPLTWRNPRKIFVNSMSDLFHEGISAEEIATVYAIAVAAHHLRGHVFQVLTKRPERMREVLRSEEFWDQVNAEAGMHVTDRVDPLSRRSGDARATLDDYGPDEPPPGIWLGVSVEDRHTMLDRGALLKDVPAAIRFWSFEPMLGPSGHIPRDIMPDWVIAGGESGPGARPMHLAWVRSLRDQCAAAGTPFHFKQWGEWIDSDQWLDHITATGLQIFCDAVPWQPERPLNFADAEILAEMSGRRGLLAHQSDGTTLIRLGKEAAGRLLDGRTHNAFPEGSIYR